MENRYLYKAKTTPKEKGEFNNVWVIGNLIVSNGKYYIHPVGNIVKVRNEIGRIIVMHEVISDTICQCTGLKDKNGNLIWENDIVKAKYSDGFEEITEVAYSKNGYSPYLNEYECEGCCCYCEVTEIEIIGNIFDNPELLESEEN